MLHPAPAAPANDVLARLDITGGAPLGNAPWYVRLQVARMRSGLPAGFPLDEPDEVVQRDLDRFGLRPRLVVGDEDR